MSMSYMEPAEMLGSSTWPDCDAQRVVSKEFPLATPQGNGAGALDAAFQVLFSSLVAVGWSVRYSFSLDAATVSVEPSGTPTFLVRTHDAVLLSVLISATWIEPVFAGGTAPT